MIAPADVYMFLCSFPVIGICRGLPYGLGIFNGLVLYVVSASVKCPGNKRNETIAKAALGCPRL